eukprot:TRINITY_DN17608_c3_g1_i1.p1 TRINITY_DN17608_c3_g1~~TRINITY_DN17608_c3_g1_i1.p1  ORF type:complete len:146 (-),score=14.68 TRINITY_DN17608_c3_g1_i1:425-862(-)
MFQMGAALFHATFLEGFIFKKYKLVKLGVCFVREERDLPDGDSYCWSCFLTWRTNCSLAINRPPITEHHQIFGDLCLEHVSGRRGYPSKQCGISPNKYDRFGESHWAHSAMCRSSACAIFQDLKQGGLAFDIYPRDLANDISSLF